MKIKHSICITAALLFLAATVTAEDTAANPAGTWNVTYIHDGKTLTYHPILKLKVAGEDVTGTLSRAAGSKTEELVLEKGKLNGSDISFSTHYFTLLYDHNVLQPTDTNKVTHVVFKGKISGDTIKGEFEKQYMDNSPTKDQWEAKRVKM
jgi:hypothetical protein